MLQQEICPINCDVAFKAIFGSKDDHSERIRIQLVELLIHKRITSCILLNSEMTSHKAMGKTTILDVLARDEEGVLYDLEMQTTGNTKSEIRRFDAYEAQMILSQLKKGDDYDVLQATYQILFINAYATETNHSLLNHYQWRNEEGECDFSQRHRIVLSLAAVNEIVEGREENELSELEQMSYLFKNGKPYGKMEVQGKLVKMIMEKYNNYLGDKWFWSDEMVMKIGKRREQLLKQDYYEEGVEKGLIEGKQQSLIETLLEQIQMKYEVNAEEWLSTLTYEQLVHIRKLILTTDIFSELKMAVQQ